jgi:hypothetical protein
LPCPRAPPAAGWPAPVGQWPRLNNAAPSLQPHYRAFGATTGCSAPAPRIGTVALAVVAACGFSRHAGLRSRRHARNAGSHVPYESLVELRAAYMPDVARAVSGHPQLIPEGRVTTRFWHRLIRFRHFCDGSLALASLDRACRDHRPGVSATLTTTALDRSSLRWLEIGS